MLSSAQQMEEGPFLEPEAERHLRWLEDAHLRLAREGPAAFCSFVLRDEETHGRVLNSRNHAMWHDLITEHDRVVIWAHVEAAKALPLDTPIPTPAGFASMGRLAVGDVVFDAFGKPCKIAMATEAMLGHACYRVSFDDGTSQVADGGHQWRAWNVDDLHAGRSPRVVTTEEMLAKLKRGRDCFWKVPICGAVQREEKELPLDPYFFGCWLGDGDSRAAMITTADDELVQECKRALGLREDQVTYCQNDEDFGSVRVYFRGIRALLSPFFGNKHIPREYMEGSEGQRRALLAGLCDTDGHPQKGVVAFSTVSLAMAERVAELARGLGFKASVRERHGWYKDLPHFSYQVRFTAKVPVFRLKRKLDKQRLGEVVATRHKTVIDVEPVESVPVRCIAVDSETRTYLCGREYLVTHNTQQISVGRAMWELGKNPNLRIVCVSNTDGMAQKICTQVAKYIENSVEVHAVFPNLRRARGLPWTAHRIFVDRETRAKDPSFQTCGVHGNILGSRIDLLILDDILDYESTWSETMRADTNAWFKATLEGRLTAKARVIALGMVWNLGDLLHVLAGTPLYKSVRSPVMDEEGEPTWPEQWPAPRIEKKLVELGPLEFARQMMCRPISETEARFKPEWIEACKARGEGRELCYALSEVPTGYRVFTGVDLGVRDSATASETVLFTIAVHPDESREVLDVTAGRWHGPDIVEKIIDAHRRYHSVLIVENNAAQDFIIQFTRKRSAVPIKPFTTTARAASHPSFGVESLGAEMAAAKWIIPNRKGVCHPEVEKWINELIYYDPRGHNGDRLMASWFAREGARTALRFKVRTGRVDLMSR